jgi:hypothetical protein
MLEGAFAAAADGQTTSERAEARIGTRRPRRPVAHLARMLLVGRPHGRMPLPPPLAAYSCRLRSRLATGPDAGARRRRSPPPADDTRRCTTARRFGLLPVSARWKRQRLETRGARDRYKARAAPAPSQGSSKEILGFLAGQLLRDEAPCGISPMEAENFAVPRQPPRPRVTRRPAQRGTRPCR